MFVEVGKIVGVWGVKGWLKIHSYTQNRNDIADYPAWYLAKQMPTIDNQPFAHTVLGCKTQGRGMVALIEGTDTREAAEHWLGYTIFIAESDLPELAEDEYYWHQLIGLHVVNVDGLQIGQVTGLLETGANDVLVVRPEQVGESQSPEVLIPYTREVVKKVDLDPGRMTVEWDVSWLDN